MDAYTIERIYDAQGHTGNSYYVRFVEVETGLIYDPLTHTLSALTTWEDSATVLDEDDSNGSFPVIVPAELPTGKRYDFIVYKQAGSNPVNTDDVQKQKTFVHGSFFGF